MINKTNVKQWWYLKLLAVLSLSVLQTVGLNRNFAFAQNNIVPDDTLGSEKSRVVPFEGNSAIDTIQGGAIRDSNLFHSFQEFNIGAENGAYFFSPNREIQNILARVTGRNPSEILGILGTRVFDGNALTSSNANLFLINPNGIVFGENARLDVGGSFIATTADGIEFGEQGVFSASNPQIPQRLSVNPSAFFFNQVANQQIVNKSRATNATDPSFIDGLRVPDDKHLLLLGGDITVDGGFLNALGGKIELGGLAAPGTVNLNIDGNNLDATFPSNADYSNISLENQAFISTNGVGGGEIQIQGNNIALTDNSSIVSFTNGERDGKGINIKAKQLNMFGASNIQTGATSTGNSGDISIEVENLDLQNRSQIGSLTFAAGGNASNIVVQANDIKLNNSTIGSFSAGRGDAIGTGSAGNINIEAKTLDLQNSSSLLLNSLLGQGNAGNLNLEVTESINVTRSTVSTSSLSTGLGGDIDVNTKNLNVNNGSQVITSNFDISNFDLELLPDPIQVEFLRELIGTVEPENIGNLGQENSGNVTINASESVTLSGISANGQTRNGIFTGTFSNGTSGNLVIKTEQLKILDGAAVLTSTTAKGAGGNIEINADTVELIGTSNDGKFPSGLGSETNGVDSSAKAGNVTLNTRILNIRDGGIISTQTSNQGKGGDLTITARESLNIAGVVPSTLPDPFFRSGLSTSTQGSGEAGSLKIFDTGAIKVEDGGIILASTFNQGAGGNVEIDADTVELIGASPNGQFPSGLGSETRGVNSSAKAGNVALNTRILNIRDAGVISTQTYNQGKGGNLTITARESFNISGISPSSLPKPNNPFFRSALVTTTNSSGTAGNIKIVDTGIIKVEDGGIILASTINQGNSGNIEINADTLELIGISTNGQFPSGLSSETSGVDSSAKAGNIILNTRNLNLRDGGIILASTFNRGNGGNIEVNTDTLELIGVSTNGQFRSGLFSETSGVDSSAKAGNVTLDSRILNIRDGGAISTQTFNQGKGGNLTVTARESLNINGISPSSLPKPNNPFFRSALVTTTGGFGSAGNIKIIDTGIIKIENGGVISASSLNQGDSGNIEINADTLEIIGVSANGEFRNGLFSLTPGVDSFSTAGNGVFSITSGVDSSAKAGDIALNTRNLSLRDGAVLSTQSTNQGEAGNITIQNDGGLQLTGSSILTNSSESSGGSINITAKDIRLFDNSDIRTNVNNGTASGGNITLTANTIITLDNSDILSFSADGKGGDITFNTAGFFSNPLYKPTPPIRDRQALNRLNTNGQVDVNASGTVSGTITGVPDTTFIQDSLTDLPDNQIDTNTIIANSCVVRSNQQNGTFLITGSGGLPINPSDAPLSSYSTGSIRSIPSNTDKSPASNRQNWKIGDPVVEPQGVYKLPNGQLVLSRECG